LSLFHTEANGGVEMFPSLTSPYITSVIEGTHPIVIVELFFKFF
jgi:hypothetical protein